MMQYYQKSQSVSVKFGGIFDTILNTINKELPVVLGTAQSLSKPKGSQPAKGLAQIQAVVNQVLQALQQLLAGAPQTPQADTVNNAGQLVSILDNPAQVTQAKHGDDAKALSDGKAKAASLYSQIQAKYAPVATGTGTVVTTDATGQIVTTTIPVASGQSSTAVNPLTSNPLILIGGFGLVAVWIISRNK